jgi:hypothetical protein
MMVGTKLSAIDNGFWISARLEGDEADLLEFLFSAWYGKVWGSIAFVQSLANRFPPVTLKKNLNTDHVSQFWRWHRVRLLFHLVTCKILSISHWRYVIQGIVLIGTFLTGQYSQTQIIDLLKPVLPYSVNTLL